MENYASAFWLEQIDALTTVGTLRAQRWVIEELETSGFIKIGFPFCEDASITITDIGQRFLQRNQGDDTDKN